MAAALIFFALSLLTVIISYNKLLNIRENCFIKMPLIKNENPPPTYMTYMWLQMRVTNKVCLKNGKKGFSRRKLTIMPLIRI